MRKAKVNTLMPWCALCDCFHDEAVPHVPKAQERRAAKIRFGEIAALTALIRKYPREAELILNGKDTEL